MPLLYLVTVQWLYVWLIFGIAITTVELGRAYHKRKIIIVKDIAWALLCAVNWPFGFIVSMVRLYELAHLIWMKIAGAKFDNFLNAVVIRQKE